MLSLRNTYPRRCRRALGRLLPTVRFGNSFVCSRVKELRDPDLENRTSVRAPRFLAQKGFQRVRNDPSSGSRPTAKLSQTAGISISHEIELLGKDLPMECRTSLANGFSFGCLSPHPDAGYGIDAERRWLGLYERDTILDGLHLRFHDERCAIVLSKQDYSPDWLHGAPSVEQRSVQNSRGSFLYRGQWRDLCFDHAKRGFVRYPLQGLWRSAQRYLFSLGIFPSSAAAGFGSW